MAKSAVQAAVDIIARVAGIHIASNKLSMVRTRLTKRMLDLGISSEKEYLAYLEANGANEQQALVSLLTTHTTQFFREYLHFEYLAAHGLARLVDGVRKEGRKALRAWCAACSKGPEVYSLAMFLDHHLRRIDASLDYEILGSDIDPESLRIARNGVYRWDELKEAPLQYLGRHWARGQGDLAPFVKARDSLRSRVRFEEINLLEMDRRLGGRTFDLVFCKNVFIYMDKRHVGPLTKSLVGKLVPHGLLFTGFSETLPELKALLDSPSPSVFRRRGIAAAAPASAVGTDRTGTIRVLVVDDSATVRELLKRIFSTENGFEVVATAGNGIEAAQALKATAVDVITLDIHMPVQGGIEFLRANPELPPVVIISSVPREDADQGLEALRLGAKDYVEKPGIEEVSVRAEEIRTKVRVAARSPAAPPALELTESFRRARTIFSPDTKLRVIVAGAGDRKAVAAVLDELSPPQPPTLILFHGAKSLLDGLAAELGAGVYRGDPPARDRAYVADFESDHDRLRDSLGERRVSILIFRSAPAAVGTRVSGWPHGEIILEEGGESFLRRTAHQVVPATSFAFLSCLYLSQDPLSPTP